MAGKPYLPKTPQKGQPSKILKGAKIVFNMGGNAIDAITGTSTVENMRGLESDTKRKEVLRRRESRRNDKAMGL